MNADSLTTVQEEGAATGAAAAKAPTFTIQICNFNHGHYLPDCLAGIARQSFRDFEVVITDDGSTDGSQAIISAAAARDARIKPRYFKQNQGLMAAIKDTFERARGTYIFGEAADDFIIDENFFRKAATALKQHPDAAGFFGVAGLVCAETKQATGTMGSAARAGFIPAHECYRDILRGVMFVPGSSSIWKRELLQDIGFDYSLGPQIDFLINHALPARHGVVFDSRPVTVQRWYQNATSFGSRSGTLWDVTGRLAKVEQRLREWGHPYHGVDEDWARWRARYTIHAIRTSGLRPGEF